MPRIRYSEAAVMNLARVMKGEAEGQDPSGIGEGLVGNVVVNRVIAGSINPDNCTDFHPYETISRVVFAPHGFESTKEAPFYGPVRPETLQKAKQIVEGTARWPDPVAQEIVYSLWLFRPSKDCPKDWYGQSFVGSFPKDEKNQHCFYEPIKICEEVYVSHDKTNNEQEPPE